ncbi:MAG TPA: DUF2971 domain-containing protein, partial [Pirellulales bacterium]
MDIVLSDPTTERVQERILKTNPEAIQLIAQMDKSHAAYLQQLAMNALQTSISNSIGNVLQGVCCFSELSDHLLMWSHYANGHLGLCMEFSNTIALGQGALAAVKYRDCFPVLDADKILANADDALANVIDLWLIKAECWAYEKEWRILHSKGDCPLNYPPESLTAVYLGALMPENQQLLIKKLLEGTGTKVCKMRLEKASFKLVA